MPKLKVKSANYLSSSQTSTRPPDSDVSPSPQESIPFNWRSPTGKVHCSMTLPDTDSPSASPKPGLDMEKSQREKSQLARSRWKRAGNLAIAVKRAERRGVEEKEKEKKEREKKEKKKDSKEGRKSPNAATPIVVESSRSRTNTPINGSQSNTPKSRGGTPSGTPKTLGRTPHPARPTATRVAPKATRGSNRCETEQRGAGGGGKRGGFSGEPGLADRWLAFRVPGFGKLLVLFLFSCFSCFFFFLHFGLLFLPSLFVFFS